MSSNLTKKHQKEIRKLHALFISEPIMINPTIDLKIDSAAVTYFQDPICGKAAYYSSIDVSNAEKLADSIKELWIQSGGQINQDICLKISHLAIILKSDMDIQNPELSEFIYTLH